jgi:peptide deformylase
MAAPQLGVSQRLFVLAPLADLLHGSKDAAAKLSPAPDAKLPLAVLNPRVRRRSNAMSAAWEACLSVPGYRGRVARHSSIDVDFVSGEGKRVTGTLSGYVARAFQHEVDHLNGILYIDRLHATRDLRRLAPGGRGLTPAELEDEQTDAED